MSDWRNDGYHPIWSCIRLGLLLVLMFVVLFTTASHFDDTELKAIGIVVMGFGVGEFVIPKLRSGGTQ